ncbi:hypothetical protein Ocin01_15376 [Orchesella cincta]|uniref:Uncharacterized protein n=1 Tax=Orchesella cincta TaxID=48709 RepID=A0A1D2ME69_ORCCI|nr:hypothetical protein Ocin01_15376 [Orchesella cincta]
MWNARKAQTITQVNHSNFKTTIIMSRLFALLVLVAVIAVANAQYYGGYYGGLGTYGAGIGYSNIGYGYGGYSGLGLGYGAYYKK